MGKFFLLAIALAAVYAEPESKPYHGGVLGGHGYGGYGHYLGKRSAEADSYYGGVLGGYGYGGYGHYLGKRSAKADSYYGSYWRIRLWWIRRIRSRKIDV